MRGTVFTPLFAAPPGAPFSQNKNPRPLSNRATGGSTCLSGRSALTALYFCTLVTGRGEGGVVTSGNDQFALRIHRRIAHRHQRTTADHAHPIEVCLQIA